MIFIYQYKNCRVISEETARALRDRYPGLELLCQFHRIQDALRYMDMYSGCTENLVKKQHHGVTPEGRECMREKKLGDANPNADGLSDEHRRKISMSMKKHRRLHPEDHPMLHRKHDMQSRRKIAISMRRIPKRRWALDEHGQEHLIYITQTTLPPGWTWGRRRGNTPH